MEQIQFPIPVHALPLRQHCQPALDDSCTAAPRADCGWMTVEMMLCWMTVEMMLWEHRPAVVYARAAKLKRLAAQRCC
jgi:hypothetical protein